MVTWQSDGQDGSGYGVYQQAYAADGTARGGEVRVNTYVAGQQTGQFVTALADGGWVVTWDSYGQDGSGYGVYQQAYAADGTARGGEVRVNTYVAGNQYVSQPTALANGGWVVTWKSSVQDGRRHLSAGVRRQRFSSGRRGAGQHIRPRPARGTTDCCARQWRLGGDVEGGGSAIHQQAFDANGAPAGGEVQVHTSSGGYHAEYYITGLANGGWVVTFGPSRHRKHLTAGLRCKRFGSRRRASGQFLRRCSVTYHRPLRWRLGGDVFQWGCLSACFSQRRARFGNTDPRQRSAGGDGWVRIGSTGLAAMTRSTAATATML